MGKGEALVRLAGAWRDLVRCGQVVQGQLWSSKVG